MKTRAKNLKKAVLLAILMFCGVCFAAELHVPSQYPTIQSAINAAAKGDTVIVADGVYTGNGNRYIIFRGKAITVRSQNGPQNCIIDCKRESRGFSFLYGERPDCILNGFTITRGYAYRGGGIECETSNPTIINCILIDNWATIGGGIDCYWSSPAILNCFISNNSAAGGGGLGLYQSYSRLSNCTIMNNISKNHPAGGLWREGGNPVITNCIVWGNKGTRGTNQSSQMYGIGRTVNYCRVQGWTGSLGGIGNTGEEPSLAADKYHLESHSPCIDAGDPAYIAPSGAKDIDGEARIIGARVDIGADEFTGTLALPISLEISGPNSVAENSTASFKAICYFNNGKSRDVATVAVLTIDAAWVGSFDSFGVLHTGWIEAPIESVTIHGKYTFGGITMEDEAIVRVSLPVSIEVTGPEKVWGSNPVQYQAVASYDNGHTNNVAVRALWEVEPNSIGNIIDNKGLLNLAQMEQPEQHIIVHAQHASAGVIVQDGLAVQVSLPVRLEITGPNEASSGCAPQYRATVFYDNNQSEVVTDSALWKAEPNTLASIEDGLLQIGEASEPYEIIVYSEYKNAGITVRANKVVEVIQAPTIYVPSEFEAIQAAIDSLACVGTIIVADGVYTGEGNRDIDFQGKAITVRSENGPENCIIDCEYLGVGFYFHSKEDRDSVIDGLTIKRGEWIGISCEVSSPTIKNCIITENRMGGGISCYESSALISNCFINGNNEIYGGAVSFYGGSPEIINCIISGNQTIWEGGISCYGTDAHISGCTIIGNTGSGIWRYYDDEGQPRVTNCIVRGNAEVQIEGDIDVTYSNIEGGWENGGEPAQQDEDAWEGEGNIDADPCFAFAGDYHLMPGSPCIDAGDPNYIAEPNETDIEGKARVLSGRIDMGAYEYDPNHPVIAVSAQELIFRCVENGLEPNTQSMFIRNCGGGTLRWAISSDCNWLEVEPVEGESSGEIIEVSLTADCIGIGRGTYRSKLIVSDPDATNSPVAVQVVLHVGKLLRVPTEYQTIQAAIDAAADYDAVLVADGIYKGEGNRDIDFRGKVIMVKSENGPQNCIVDCEGTASNKYRGFIFRNRENADSVLQGFTIMNGYYPNGGAIYCETGQPTIHGCVITNNTGAGVYCERGRAREGTKIFGCVISNNAGSGIRCYDTRLEIADCSIMNNSTAIGVQSIGGIYCQESSPTIRNSTIIGNTGGGIYCERSKANIDGCKIMSNRNMYAGGGGIFCFAESVITVKNCVVSNNIAEESRGGGGGIAIEGDGKATITGCIITGNRSKGGCGYVGGGINGGYSDWGAISNCIITENQAFEDGGGIAYYNGPITNCIITGNSAGGWYEEWYSYGDGGGLAYCNGPITNCVISNNTASTGAGLNGCWGSITNCTIINNYTHDEYGGAALNHCYGPVTNCIIWANSPQQLFSTGAVTFCDVQGGWEGEGNIDADPCFVKAGYWDANGTDDDMWDDFWVEGDYRLRRQSPCADAGTDANVYTDIEGNIRPYDFPGVDNNREQPEFDMGAYELTPVEAQVSFTPKVLNCRSRGKWIKAHIALPEGISAEDIDVNAPAVVVPFGVESQYIKVAGHNPAQVEIGFDRQAICAAAGEDGEIKATVIGSLRDGRYFAGTDVISCKVRVK